MVPKPGEVYLATEEHGGGNHRLIVVSHEAFNRGTYVTVVPTTSQRFYERAKLKNCVVFTKNAFGCFDKSCVAQAEHIATIRKSNLLLSQGPVGVLSENKMREIIAAIGYAIGAECVPQTKKAE